MKKKKIIALFVCFIIILLGLIWFVRTPFEGTEDPLITQIIKIPSFEETSSSSNPVSVNCTIVNHTIKPGLNEGDNFTYKRTVFPGRAISAMTTSPTIYLGTLTESWKPLTLPEPLTLNDTYIIEEIKHSNTSTCYVITAHHQYISRINHHQEMFRLESPAYTITIDTSVRDRIICDNTTSCEDMFIGMPFALYMFALDKEFKGIIESVIYYKHKKSIFGIKVKDIEENITLKTTYAVIGEENVNNISCYKVKIIKEYICHKGNIVCNDLYLIVWVDKERRIVVQYETYHGNKLIERSSIVK